MAEIALGNLYELNQQAMNKLEPLNKEEISKIKCTLSLLDKGKAIFVTENDIIFSLPSHMINTNFKVGNSYMINIEKLLNFQQKYKEIENIQNKYNTFI